MTAAREELATRIRDLLREASPLREVPMFGGVSFLVDERMVVAAQRDGGLLVRVDPKESQELLKRPGCSLAEMGAGRVMGPSWLAVSAEHLVDSGQLAWWVEQGMRRNRPGSGPGRPL